MTSHLKIDFIFYQILIALVNSTAPEWRPSSNDNLDMVLLSQRKYNLDYQSARKNLGRFGLVSHAHTIKTKDLSGICQIVFVNKSFKNVYVKLISVTAWTTDSEGSAFPD